MIDGRTLRIIRSEARLDKQTPRPLRDLLGNARDHDDVTGKSSPIPDATDRPGLQSAALELLTMLRRREEVLPSRLIGEAAWHILLAAYSSLDTILQTKELCLASDVPEATALRWLQVLDRQGLLEKAVHPIRRDQRATYYQLTPLGRAKVGHALEAMLRT